MGLDMYLIRRKKYRKNENEYKALARKSAEEVMYWRKANQIRRWIVNNTKYDEDDNCEYIELTKKDLVALRDDCLKVLNNHELANEIMPVSTGFCFGSTEYDDWYFEKLEYTVEKLNEILKSTNFKTQAIDYYEWW